MVVGGTAGAVSTLLADSGWWPSAARRPPPALVSASGSAGRPTETAHARASRPRHRRPELTPAPSDLFIGYEVEVARRRLPALLVDDGGDVTDPPSETSTGARGRRWIAIEAPNGLLHWRTVGGGYDGFSYIKGQSGEFLIREVYRGADGSLRYVHLAPEDT